MSLLYKVTINKNGFYDFTTDTNLHYTVYFLEYRLPDADGNLHEVYNFGFTRNKDHISKGFYYEFDVKIRNTIVSIVNDFFVKNEDRALLYFCFSDDGFGRHRSITFKQWCKKLTATIATHHKEITTEGKPLYSCCMILKDNPLERLIVDAFELNMEELAKINNPN